MTSRRSSAVALLLGLAVAIDGGVRAQEADDREASGEWEQLVLEEVVVTAQRREESLQDVPISVTAIAGDQIREGGIMTLSDVALVTPNFTFTQFNVGEPEYYIRGIGNTNDSAGSDPAVGVFIDDVYIGRTGGTSTDLYDIERIEVLRGPQGTLFGKNVVGGAISIYTRKPTPEFESRAGVTFGNYDSLLARGLVNGALTDTLSGSFSFSRFTRDGYVRNVEDGLDYQDADNFSARGQLLLQPHGDLDVLLGLDYSHDDLAGNCRNVNNLDLNDPLGLAFLYPPVIEATTGGDLRKCASTAPAGQDRTVKGALLRVDWTLEAARLASITAYREADYDWAEDLAGLPLGATPFNLYDQAAEESEQFSQELRLTSHTGASFDWLLGAFYMTERTDRAENFVGSFGAPLAEQGFLLLDGDIVFGQRAKTTSYAVFGKFDWHLSDTVTLSVGGRWAKDKKRIDQALINREDPARDVAWLSQIGHPDPRVVLGIPANGPEDLFAYLLTGDAAWLKVPYQAQAEDSWSQFLPSAYLDWQFAESSLAYVSYSKGYKSGAFQSQTTTAQAAVTPLDPEQASNYEIGLKTELLDRRLRLNAAVFHIKYTDLQVFQLIGSLLVGGNAEVTSQGVELDAQAIIRDNWVAGATYGYLDPTYDVYELGSLDFSGNRLSRASKHSWSVNTAYRWDLPGGSDIELSAVYSYKSDFYFEPSNVPASRQEGFGLLDARLAWNLASWEVSAWGRNLTDEQYRINTFVSNIAGTVDLWSLPRTYGVTVAYHF